MKRLIAAVAAVPLLVVSTGSVALAAPNPNTTGQPNQSCQAEPSGPPGLLSTTNGFATKAVNVYAGAPNTESAEANAKAVSQYDVACYQVSQH